MLDEGILLGVGLLAPLPVAFTTSANLIPQNTRTEPYAITNRGLRILLRVLEYNLPIESYTHFAIP